MGIVDGENGATGGTAAADDQRTGEELLAAVTPEEADLARRFSDRLAGLQRRLDENDEDYERGWVDAAGKVANAVCLDRVVRLEKRVADVEATMADVATAESIIARVTAEHGTDPEAAGEGGEPQ